MFGALILGILAGAAAPWAEVHVRKALEGALMAEPPLSAVELRAVSLALCLLAAAVLAWLTGEGGAVPLTLGAAIGVFGPRLTAWYRGRD